MPRDGPRHAAVAIDAVPAQAGAMTMQPAIRPTIQDAPSLGKALAVIFTVSLAIGVVSTYVLAAIRPALFV